MAIETLLAANGLYIAGSAYLMNGQLIQINDTLRSIDNHIRPKTRFIVDAHYGISDEVLEAISENGTMQIIGRNHVWTVHMGTLGAKEEKVLLARIKPSALYDVVIQMEALACDYGCPYEFDDGEETVSELTYEEDKCNDEAIARLDADIKQSNSRIDELAYRSNNAGSGYWGLSALGALVVVGGIVLTTASQTPSVIFGVLGIIAGIGMAIGGGVLQSRANDGEPRDNTAMMAETKRRDELVKKKNELLKKAEELKSNSRS